MEIFKHREYFSHAKTPSQINPNPVGENFILRLYFNRFAAFCFFFKTLIKVTGYLYTRL